jgi:hypothetical protein
MLSVSLLTPTMLQGLAGMPALLHALARTSAAASPVLANWRALLPGSQSCLKLTNTVRPRCRERLRHYLLAPHCGTCGGSSKAACSCSYCGGSSAVRDCLEPDELLGRCAARFKRLATLSSARWQSAQSGR